MHQALLLSGGEQPIFGTYAYILFLCFLQDISTVYQIFPDEVLGSGQFGIVYGGNVPVYLQRVEKIRADAEEMLWNLDMLHLMHILIFLRMMCLHI